MLARVFAGNGYGGQFLHVVPEYDLISVFNGWTLHETPGTVQLDRPSGTHPPRHRISERRYPLSRGFHQIARSILNGVVRFAVPTRRR